MGGTQASSDAPSRLATPSFPSEPGCLVVDEFRRTYLGSCRAGVSALLDTTKDRRKDCEDNVLDNIEGVVDGMCIGGHRHRSRTMGNEHVMSRAAPNPVSTAAVTAGTSVKDSGIGGKFCLRELNQSLEELVSDPKYLTSFRTRITLGSQ